MWANQSVYQIKLNIKYNQSNDHSTCKRFLGRECQIEGGPPTTKTSYFYIMPEPDPIFLKGTVDFPTLVLFMNQKD